MIQPEKAVKKPPLEEDRTHSLLAWFRLRRHGFRQDDSGQALLAVGILSLALIMFALSIMPVGAAVQRRIQLQTAADAAALSAGTWIARGGNMIQAGNGFQYDMHALTVLIVEIVTYVYIAKICSDIAQIFAGNIFAVASIIVHWFEGIDKIAKANRWTGYARDFSTIPLATMVPGFGQLALAESSATARLNGAALIDSQNKLDELFSTFDLKSPGKYETLHKDTTKWLAKGEASNRWWEMFVNIVDRIPIVGQWIAKAIEDLVQKDASFDHYAWPLSPTYAPESTFNFAKMTNFKEWGATPEGIFSPLVSHFYWPFVESLIFLQFIHWDTPYARLASEVDGGSKEHKSTTYTLAVRDNPTNGYYGKLPFAKEWFGELPSDVAVSSVKVYNDRLTDAGCKSSARWYVSTPLFAIPIWPLPLVRLFYGYGGDFKVEQTPVAFRENYKANETKGRDLLIYH